MTAFHEGGFAQRQWAMGDTAEGVFEDTADKGWVRFGLNRPPLNMAMLPPFLRYTPDYLQSHRLVEVQAMGKDGVLKVKDDKLDALESWNEFHPVHFFVWDAGAKRYGTVEIGGIYRTIHDRAAVRSVFANDGKAYWAIKRNDLPIEWTPFEGELR